MSPHLRALAFELWDASRECSRGSKHHRVRITLSHLKPQYASQGNAHEAPCHCLHPLDSESPALAWHTRVACTGEHLDALVVKRSGGGAHDDDGAAATASRAPGGCAADLHGV